MSNINVELFNDTPYKFNVAIYDAEGNYMNLNANAFQNLTIEDSIFIPFSIGTMCVVNVNDVLQSSSAPGAPALNFAGNNHDLLAIDIMPAVTTQGIEADASNEELRRIFNLNTLFCINELHDSDEKSDRVNNVMNFRDAYQQVMMETSAQFSSVDVLQELGRLKGDAENLNNSERAVEAGELIMYLLEKTFPDADVIDKPNFDKGHGQLFFHSQGNSNAFQDMMHINSLQMSEQEHDACIVNLDRYTKKFTNMAFSKYFELQQTKPKEYVLEAFIVSDGQSGAGQNKPPSSHGGLDITSNIIEYKLSPINGNEFTRKITNAVYNATAGADKNHYVGMKQNNLKTILQKYTQLYVEPFKSIAPNAQPSIDFNKFIDQGDKKQLRPRVVNATLPFKYEEQPRNSMFIDLLVSGGDNIVFRSLGSTHRRSGRFIDITSMSQIADNKLANSLLGRWFVVKVKHIFAGNKYYNIIEAVKTYKQSK